MAAGYHASQAEAYLTGHMSWVDVIPQTMITHIRYAIAWLQGESQTTHTTQQNLLHPRYMKNSIQGISYVVF